MKTTIQIKPSEDLNFASSDLLIIIGKSHCSAGVIDHLSNELLGYTSYDFSEQSEAVTILNDEELFKNRFNKVLVGYDSCESVLVPAMIFKNEDIQLYIQSIYGMDVQSSVIAEHLPAWDLYNVYRLPTSLHAAIQMKFISGNSWHLYTIMLKNYHLHDDESIIIDFKTNEFSFVAFRSGKLLLAQTFGYETPEDILYYLLKTCQHLGFSQKEVRLVLSGLIEKDSSVYRELYKYFIHAEFDHLYGQMKISEALAVNPEHYYSTISKLAACV